MVDGWWLLKLINKREWETQESNSSLDVDTQEHQFTYIWHQSVKNRLHFNHKCVTQSQCTCTISYIVFGMFHMSCACLYRTAIIHERTQDWNKHLCDVISNIRRHRRLGMFWNTLLLSNILPIGQCQHMPNIIDVIWVLWLAVPACFDKSHCLLHIFC